MEIRKIIAPHGKNGKPLDGAAEREYIFFTVNFNNHRVVGNSALNEVIDKNEIDTCECVLSLPDCYSDTGAQTPLILSCHGAGGRVCEAENKVGGVEYVSRCIDAGYAALDVNGSLPHGLTMGCPEHIFALYKAYRYAVKNYNLSERVLISGASMGGHTAMNFAHTFPSVSLAIGIFFPRLNIDGVLVDGHYCIGTWDKNERKNGNPSTKDRIIDVYHFESGEWNEENTIGFNPYKTRSFINQEGKRVVIPPCPIKIWQGTDDTVVDPVMVKEFVDSVKRSGSYIELHMLNGVKHNINDVMRLEQLLWFDRFI